VPHPVRWSPRRVTALAQRIEQRLTFPVIVAACASIPAVFLTIWQDGQYEIAGKVIGWASASILWAETVILLLAAENKRLWLRRNVGLMTIGALTLLTLLVAAGGAQLLRLIRVLGAIRLLRAKRIFKASQVLHRRLDYKWGLNIWWKSALFSLGGLLCAVFAAVVLVDPTAQHIELVRWFNDNLRLIPVVAAGAILAGATWLVMRGREDDDEPDAP
jgi:hypothetical protein